MDSFDSLMFLTILPEILLVVLAGLVLAFDALWSEERRRSLGWVTAGGLAAIIITTLLVGQPGDTVQYAFGNMVRHDWLSFSFKLVFLFSAAITSLFAIESEGLGKRGEFFILLLVSTVGMTLMASAVDFIMLYLAIEMTSIPLYVLAGFLRNDNKSTEAGFKYLLYGAMTSAIMLYGFSLIFGFTGTTSFDEIALKLHSSIGVPIIGIVGALLLVLVGFGFKVSIVPFHFWAPDVYEGAPTPVAAFLSTASKAAGFTVLLRVLMTVFHPVATQYWIAVVVALSVLTMTIGNLLALGQKNIKRLLAYSSIAHAGYILIGLVAVTTLGMTSVVFYLIAYLLTNLAAFGAVVAFSRVVGSDEISAYSGLSRRAPGLALVMLVAYLSLAGMPPFGGFIAKVFVFAAAIDAGWVWLAMVGVLNSIIGLYYYLSVLKVVYLYRSDDENKPLPLPRSISVALLVLTLGIILIGTLFTPWFNWAIQAAKGMF